MGLRVAFLAAECEPWAKTGGLADVVDALARALGRPGGETTSAIDPPVDVFLPRYRGVPQPDPSTIIGERTLRVPDPRAPAGWSPATVVDVAADGYRLRLVDLPAAFDRDGFYGDGTADYPDNAWRFGSFGRAALEAIRMEGRPVDILHTHDWHTGPVAIARDMRYRDDPIVGRLAMVHTIHNLAYRGWTPTRDLGQLGLRPDDDIPGRRPKGVDLLLAGIEAAEIVTTVSPTYAREILTPELGMGLDGALRARGDRFVGILNGLDTDVWDPSTDDDLATTYSRADRSGKAIDRADLLERVGFDATDDGPVLGLIGRLDPQKGFDLLAAATPALLEDSWRVVVLGSGDASLADPFRELVAAEPGRVAMLERFDRAMARRIYAGVDAFAMPSRFEPCGQGQMIALRYGTPPIVHRTGGLADTVLDATTHPDDGTGFIFDEATPEALVDACARAAALRVGADGAWEHLIDRGMAVDHDWTTGSAPRYVEAYERAAAIRRGATRD